MPSNQRASDVRFRSILGVYTECAGLDLLEVESLEEDAFLGRKPASVDVGAVFGSY